MGVPVGSGGGAHWLHLNSSDEEGSDASYSAELAVRVGEVSALVDEAFALGDDACEASSIGLVGHLVSSVRALLELKFRPDPTVRADWAAKCAQTARRSSNLAIAEKLFDAARRLLEAGTGGDAIESALRRRYRADPLATIEALRRELDGAKEHGGEEVFAAAERLGSHRRAICSFAAVERRYIATSDAVAVWEHLGEAVRRGTKSHEAHCALGLLRVVLPTPRRRECYTPKMVEQWVTCWQEGSIDAGCGEADATWLTLLCRARKQTSHVLPVMLSDGLSRAVFGDAFRNTCVAVAGGRSPKATRAWPARYRWLAWVGGDSPAERCLRKIAKLVIFLVCVVHDDEAVARNMARLERLVHTLRPYYHPSNSGVWTARLALLLSELSRELAKGCARRRAASARKEAVEDDDASCDAEGTLGTYASERTSRDVAALLAPLARAGLYARHDAMVSASIASLRDLAGVAPRVVAEAIVPRLRAALEDARAVLWAHQAPAALRALAALARPLLLRSRNWTEDAESDAFLTDAEQACRVMFFDGSLPCVSPEVRISGALVDAGTTNKAPLAYVIAPLLKAALLAVDANDAAKTRSALLCFDAVLRLVKARDDDDSFLKSNNDDYSLDAMSLELGEWAPLFLERVFGCVEHREPAAKIPNHAQANGTSRYAGAVRAARDAANAELLRCVCNRLIVRLEPRARARATRQIGHWALQVVAPRGASAKDAASLVSVCVSADHELKERCTDELVEALERDAKSGPAEHSSSKLAFLLRLYAGACRALEPKTLAKRAGAIHTALQNSLAHEDKAVRRSARKLLRDVLRGLFETRVLLDGGHRQRQQQTDPTAVWPDDDSERQQIRWVRSVATDATVVEFGASLIRKYVVEPLEGLIITAPLTTTAATKGLAAENAHARRAAWLRGLRQVEKAVKGCSAVLRDTKTGGDRSKANDALAAAFTTAAFPASSEGDWGARALLVGLLNKGLTAIADDEVLRRDAKLLRAALKGGRQLLTLRGSAQIYRARPALSAVRARRRTMGCDVAERSFQRLARQEAEHRGEHDDAERALCHHWLIQLDNAQRDARKLKLDPMRCAPYETLLGHVAALAAHDYSDVRGAAADVVDASWSLYGWLLKPTLQGAVADLGIVSTGLTLRGSLARDSKRSSVLAGACTLLTQSRAALRKLTADPELCEKLLEHACGLSAQLEGLEDAAEREDVANRFDALVLSYAARFTQPLTNPAQLVSRGLVTARDPKLHWRQRYIGAFVASHALSCQDNRGNDKAWHFFAQLSRSTDDAPEPRLALCAVMRVLDKLAKAPKEAGLVTVREELALEKHLEGVLGALQREHRRERASSGDSSSRSSSPIVEHLLREARHTESRCLFPKVMVPHSSRGFRSRHARYCRRLCDHLGLGSRVFASAGLQLMDSVQASERGAACVAAAEAWAGAVRCELSTGGLDEHAAFYFESLSKGFKSATPDHAHAWVDALRYAIGGKRALAFAECKMLPLFITEWKNCLQKENEVENEEGWALTAKWLGFVAPVLTELVGSWAAEARQKARDLAAELAPFLVAAADHAFAAVRDRIGACLSLCRVADAHCCIDVPALLKSCKEASTTRRRKPDDMEDAVDPPPADIIEEEGEKRARRCRETAFSWSRYASRDGDSLAVASLLGPMLDGVADSDEDHRAHASSALVVAMHSLRPPARVEAGEDGLSILVASLREAAGHHDKWRSRHAVAVFCGVIRLHHAFALLPSEKEALLESLRVLLADAHSEVRDAACASLAAMANSATEAELASLVDRCVIDARAALSDKHDGPQRLGAVHALAASVIAFPYDVPKHVPQALVLLARHSNATKMRKSKSRDNASIREAVKATFAEFKRTHVETWDFINHFFSADEHDAFADVLTTGDYLV